ncbi:hypothetical protein LCGC14_1072220 [marine sediment metagenome]|uniref:Uncharacterized protein n=1 Tax=marine sediment metagenome TaxID=412755 RepID=A0A0F9QNR4_9ZZZZ
MYEFEVQRDSYQAIKTLQALNHVTTNYPPGSGLAGARALNNIVS